MADPLCGNYVGHCAQTAACTWYRTFQKLALSSSSGDKVAMKKEGTKWNKRES